MDENLKKTRSLKKQTVIEEDINKVKRSNSMFDAGKGEEFRRERKKALIDDFEIVSMDTIKELSKADEKKRPKKVKKSEKKPKDEVNKKQDKQDKQEKQQETDQLIPYTKKLFGNQENWDAFEADMKKAYDDFGPNAFVYVTDKEARELKEEEEKAKQEARHAKVREERQKRKAAAKEGFVYVSDFDKEHLQKEEEEEKKALEQKRLELIEEQYELSEDEQVRHKKSETVRLENDEKYAGLKYVELDKNIQKTIDAVRKRKIERKWNEPHYVGLEKKYSAQKEGDSRKMARIRDRLVEYHDLLEKEKAGQNVDVTKALSNLVDACKQYTFCRYRRIPMKFLGAVTLVGLPGFIKFCTRWKEVNALKKKAEAELEKRVAKREEYVENEKNKGIRIKYLTGKRYKDTYAPIPNGDAVVGGIVLLSLVRFLVENPLRLAYNVVAAPVWAINEGIRKIVKWTGHQPQRHIRFAGLYWLRTYNMRSFHYLKYKQTYAYRGKNWYDRFFTDYHTKDQEIIDRAKIDMDMIDYDYGVEDNPDVWDSFKDLAKPETEKERQKREAKEKAKAKEIENSYNISRNLEAYDAIGSHNAKAMELKKAEKEKKQQELKEKHMKKKLEDEKQAQEVKERQDILNKLPHYQPKQKLNKLGLKDVESIEELKEAEDIQEIEEIREIKEQEEQENKDQKEENANFKTVIMQDLQQQQASFEEKKKQKLEAQRKKKEEQAKKEKEEKEKKLREEQEKKEKEEKEKKLKEEQEKKEKEEKEKKLKEEQAKKEKEEKEKKLKEEQAKKEKEEREKKEREEREKKEEEKNKADNEWIVIKEVKTEDVKKDSNKAAQGVDKQQDFGAKEKALKALLKKAETDHKNRNKDKFTQRDKYKTEIENLKKWLDAYRGKTNSVQYKTARARLNLLYSQAYDIGAYDYIDDYDTKFNFDDEAYTFENKLKYENILRSNGCTVGKNREANSFYRGKMQQLDPLTSKIYWKPGVSDEIRYAYNWLGKYYMEKDASLDLNRKKEDEAPELQMPDYHIMLEDADQIHNEYETQDLGSLNCFCCSGAELVRQFCRTEGKPVPAIDQWTIRNYKPQYKTYKGYKNQLLELNPDTDSHVFDMDIQQVKDYLGGRTVGNIFELGDFFLKNQPGTMLNKVSFNWSVPAGKLSQEKLDSLRKNYKNIKAIFFKKVYQALSEKRAVSLLIQSPKHYITIVGIDGEDVKYVDSLSYNRGSIQSKKFESLLTQNSGGLEIVWMSKMKKPDELQKEYKTLGYSKEKGFENLDPSMEDFTYVAQTQGVYVAKEEVDDNRSFAGVRECIYIPKNMPAGAK